MMANNEKESCLKRGRQIFCLDKVKEKDMKIYLYIYSYLKFETIKFQYTN